MLVRGIEIWGYILNEGPSGLWFHERGGCDMLSYHLTRSCDELNMLLITRLVNKRRKFLEVNAHLVVLADQLLHSLPILIKVHLL